MTERKRRGVARALIDSAKTRSRENADLVELWCLRIFFNPRVEDDKDVHARLQELVNAHFPPGAVDNGKFERACARLQSRLNELEALSPQPSDVLARNLAQARAALALSQEEAALLAFAVLIHTDSALDSAGDLFGYLENPQTFRALDETLGFAPGTAQQALRDNGNLVASGLLQLDRDRGSLQSKLELLDGVASAMLTAHERPEDLFRAYLQPGEPSRLGREDYAHVSEEVGLLERYLADANRHRRHGVNILIHGPSGTGKTQLARVLAAALGLRLYEVPTEDHASHDDWESQERFRAYRLAQRLLAPQAGRVILFDEVEDLFPATFHGMFKQDKLGKALVNDLLETNPVPALWLSNNVWQMDPAAVRRFDVVLELGTPSRAVRRRILDKHLSGLPVRPVWLARMAEHEQLPPAVVERAAKVVAVLGGEAPQRVEQTLERVLGNTLEAMGLPRAAPTAMQTLTPYRLDALNPDTDLAALAAGLKRDPRGRLCLYGPPGTGKTAFGAYLARELDRPLLVRRAADLLDPYVGMTERHIARMFEQAEREEALLLLDEADGFLRDRTRAHRSWEVTQVNELLTRMEVFDGLFVCSTNLMEDLDAAALRRFDLKIRLDYLRPEQAWRLFRDTLKSRGVSVREKARWLPRLARIGRLTPGDFATVLRRERLAAEPLTAMTLFEGLRRESDFKADREGRGIGFTAEL